MTRPGSPGSEAPEAAEDADWTFAQREAALARLHGLDPGLESLPDEDLNKLFDRITKLKTMRDTTKGRPESSLSMIDDMWSESGPQASDTQTDDTSLETNGVGSPEVEESFREIQGQLEATKLEYENRLNALGDEQADDLRVEKEHMELQLKMVHGQMKRLLDLRARGATEEELVVFEPAIYTAKELRLIRKVLDKWRGHRSFSMAETVLSGAVMVKEANVIRFADFYYLCLYNTC